MNENHPATNNPNPVQAVEATPTPESASMDVPHWKRIAAMAGLAVLGITPWAQAQLAPLDPPPAVICPPLTAIATPTLFDVYFGTTPIRFPFQ